MRLASVLVLTCVVEFIGTQTTDKPESKEKENGDPITPLDHTFVALIDIVFTDNSKRTCTGSIIHDNVVITAAHCFKKQNNPGIKPELTISFVVIGTKKMFETGYEQYLPIERVITHPRFSGWTADLCLVYTFAGMTSDKPGTIIPLAGEETSTHVDANVTVLSWGRMKDVDSQKDWEKPEHEKCPDSTSLEQNNEDYEIAHKGEKRVTSMLEDRKRQRASYVMTPNPFNKKQLQKEKDSHRYESKVKAKTRNKPAPLKSRSQNMKLISRYLSGEERSTKSRHIHRHRIYNKTTRHHDEIMYEDATIETKDIFKHNRSVTHPGPEYTYESIDNNWKMQMKTQTESDQDILYWHADSETQKRKTEDSVKSYYKNWRRQMGKQHNQLTVELFGFMNLQACKKLVQKGMPSLYDISDANDVVCYSAEDHFISDEDSGAPAIRFGQLVAVTVGGAEVDGDHVAIGMKMSCYCSWIADNLPGGDSQLQCCLNCCDVKHKEESHDR